jgi:N6-adenosine-specific RNA methylase IME4
MSSQTSTSPDLETIGKYRVHPVASLFPLLEGKELDELVEDIRAHGLREEILVDEQGRILDGRNRANACLRLGIEPATTLWQPGPGDSVIALVVSLNVKRRHLDPSAKAVLAEKLEPMFASEAKQRQRHGGREKVGKKFTTFETGKAAVLAAKAAGANPHYVADVKALRTQNPEIYMRVVNGELKIPEAKAALKAQHKQRVVEQIRNEPEPLPAGPFRVIVADPPWPYCSRADDATHRAQNPYPDMTLEEIRALPIATLAAPDAVLWLWTTNAFQREAYTVLDAWGFEHKTTLTWTKNQIGLGDWLRARTEHCLMAVRGRPVVTLTNQTTAIIADRGRHSEKPAKFYELVESLCPGAKLEMFARSQRKGWTAWGAEAPKPSVA